MLHLSNIDRCDGCGLCVDNCPLGVLEVKAGKVTVSDGDLCTDCGICREVCPNGVIER